MIRDSKYILKRIIIGVGIAVCLFYLKSCDVYASITSSNVWASGTYMRPGVNIGTHGSYVNMEVNWQGVPDDLDDPSQPVYVSVAICRTWASSGIDDNGSPGGGSSSFGIQNTNIKCPFANSQYNLTGFVSIITFKNYGGGSYNRTLFKIYTALNTSGTYYTDMQLIDINYSLTNFRTSADYSDIGVFEETKQTNTLLERANQLIYGLGDIMQSNQNRTDTWLERVRDTIKKMNDDMNDDSIDESDQDNKINSIKNSGYNNSSISSIVLLPVRVFQSAVSGLSSNSCNSISLGSMYNTELILPCISSNDMQTWLSSTLYTLIDILMSFCVILGIRKLVLKIYSTIVYLRDGGGTID